MRDVPVDIGFDCLSFKSFDFFEPRKTFLHDDLRGVVAFIVVKRTMATVTKINKIDYLIAQAIATRLMHMMMGDFGRCTTKQTVRVHQFDYWCEESVTLIPHGTNCG